MEVIEKRDRISKEEWYMNIARDVAQRSTCLRAIAGAIVVKNDAIISQGYSGSPRGEPNCCDIGVCERDRLGIDPGKNYEICRSLHAEMNCIINAARNGVSVLDADIYIYFERLDEQKIKHGEPCLMCSRMIKNAGIKKVIFREII